MARMKKTHANRGRGWETKLNRIHKRYETSGLAYITRLHPPYLMRKSLGKGSFEGILLGQGPPDYLICSSGYTLLVDAKESKTNRLSYSGVPEHQAFAFDQIRKCGGDKMGGMLLVNFAKANIAVALDWRDVRERYYFWARQRVVGKRSASGEASLTVDSAQESGLWWGDSLMGGCDYLPTCLLALHSRVLEKEE